MRFRIEIECKIDKETKGLDVKIRRIGRVPRIFGGLAAGLHFSVTECVRNYLKNIGGKPDGETVSK